MGKIIDLIITADNIVWGMPLIILILASGIYFTVRLQFVQLSNIRHQISLLFKTTETESEAGISPIQSFFSIVAYRVGTGNVAGVAVAICSGGPGAVFWMMVCSLAAAAMSFAECTLGQMYKIRQDGEYRGGSYYYMNKALGFKKLAWLYAFLTFIFVPFLTIAPHANSIATGITTSMGIPSAVVGIIVAIMLFAIISGGIRRIAHTATVLVPVMTVTYFALTIFALAMNITVIPHFLGMIVSSAFGVNAVFGGILGSAITWGVKRSINSSGAGMGESVPAAAAAECDHPVVQGLVNSFSVFIDLAVCLCTALLVMVTDCFNVIDEAGNTLYIGQGTTAMAQYAETGESGISWTQQAAGTLLPGNIGQIIVALCLFFFAFTTVLNYYYEGETALSYLARHTTTKVRKTWTFILRILMPLAFFVYTVIPQSGAFSVGEVAVGILVWINVICMLLLTKPLVKVHRDYMQQLKEGKEPVFDPKELGIEHADLWTELLEERKETQA